MDHKMCKISLKKNKNDRIGKERKRINLGTSKNLQSGKIFLHLVSSAAHLARWRYGPFLEIWPIYGGEKLWEKRSMGKLTQQPLGLD